MTNSPKVTDLNLTEFLYHLENPQVYTGREINAARGEFSPHNLNVCLVFPEKYEIGMSHYGLILLYHLLNRQVSAVPGGTMPVHAERCFLPGKPSIQTFKTHRVPLFSLENKIPLKEFDVIGFSLLSELNFTNVLQVLDLAGIPLNSRDRQDPFPLVAAGGISVINPEPLREFIDVFGIGDGEAIFPDLLDAAAEAKITGADKQTLLQRLDKIESLYVPALYPPVKKGRFYAPDLETGAIKKRTLKNLEVSLADDRVIVPLGNVVFDRLNVEIARGCPKNCRFCQAKSYYSPYRYASLEKNLHHITRGLKETGFETFSLSTLSTGDYPYLNEILQAIPPVIAQTGVSFSLSSLRPSTLSHRLLSTLALFKRTGITIAAEAGTQRLRNVINKDVTDEEIFQAVNLAMQNQWQKIKLYFMLGLPTETREDLEGIIRLIKQILEMARTARQKIKLHVSFASFVPKPHTPFQWARRADLKELQEKIAFIKTSLRTARPLDVDIHIPHNGVVETIMARGDYRVGQLLLKALEKGEIFTAWDGDFHYPTWEEMIRDTVYEEFLGEFSPAEPLPWDFLQVNFRKEYLEKEYRDALAGIPTPSCTQQDCKNCRGCIYGMKGKTLDIPIATELKPLPGTEIEEKTGIISPGLKPLPGTGTEEKPGTPGNITYNRVRIVYEKTGEFVFLSHLTLMKYLERLIRKAGIRFKCTEGYTPRIKIVSLPPLPVFAAGLEEVVELFVDAALGEQEILARLKPAAAPEGFKFKSVLISNEIPPLSRDLHLITYEISGENLRSHIDEIAPHLIDTDFAAFTDNGLSVKIDYSRQGPERWGKIYRLIDPEKKRTRYLTRTQVTFKSRGEHDISH